VVNSRISGLSVIRAPLWIGWHVARHPAVARRGERVQTIIDATERGADIPAGRSPPSSPPPQRHDISAGFALRRRACPSGNSAAVSIMPFLPASTGCDGRNFEGFEINMALHQWLAGHGRSYIRHHSSGGFWCGVASSNGSGSSARSENVYVPTGFRGPGGLLLKGTS
jgi:hypothetical protein